MTELAKFYPSEQNLGKNCSFWDLKGRFAGCNFPRVEMQGRTSCERMIDDVCLLLKDGRRPSSLTEEQIRELKLRIPKFDEKHYIPPGDIS
ncbi:hypothetical protein HYT18_02215 [Candidatus Microgenomates bacterium]|nr:hypothetical protein [Candidatus Microgenomates bacterium]